MLKYKFTVKGKSNKDGFYYSAECFCNGMSKDELEEYIKSLDFQRDTVKVIKEKIKK